MITQSWTCSCCNTLNEEDSTLCKSCGEFDIIILYQKLII